MSEDPSSLRSVGRGLVQINLRLTKILEAVQAGPASSAAAGPPGRHLEALLDLVDAVDKTLELAPHATPVPWWARWLPRPPGPDLEGLRLARAQVLEHLRDAGVEPIAPEGPLDPGLHTVLDTRPTTDPGLQGVVAHTHRRGWARRGDPPSVVRPALVTAYVRPA